MSAQIELTQDVRWSGLLVRAQHLRRLADSVATIAAYVAGALFLLISLYIAVDVALRAFLGSSTGASFEISNYILACAGTWAMAYGLTAQSHVRIDVLLPYFPARLRAALDLVALALMAAFALSLTVFSWQLMLSSLEVGERAVSNLRMPVFIPQTLMAVGFTTLTLEALVLLVVGLVEFVMLPAAHRAATSVPESTQQEA